MIGQLRSALMGTANQQGLQNMSSLQQQLQQQHASQLVQAYQAVQAHKATVMDPNKIEAYQVPLSTVVNMWRAKFGDEWVTEQLLKESFYKHAYVRLTNNKLFEHAGADYVRLLEGV